MKVSESEFGMLPDGTRINRYDIEGGEGVSASIIDYGAILASLRVPDRRGGSGAVTCGFDTLDGYLGINPYFGATIGRFANRIAWGAFSLGGKSYPLFKNDGEHHLHGGKIGFDKRVWSASCWAEYGTAFVRLELDSPDGEEGYPGNLKVSVTYSLDDEMNLSIRYRAETDAPTPVNLTNHTYWNLDSPGKSIGEHVVSIYADGYLPVNENLIPTGIVKPVSGTPFDLRTGRELAPTLAQTDGYYHCFVLRESSERLRHAATVQHPDSGRKLEVYATQPGMQFYTGNFLDGIRGSGGVSYGRQTAFCLETEGYPDAVNQPRFPSAVLEPGRVYVESTIYRISW